MHLHLLTVCGSLTYKYSCTYCNWNLRLKWWKGCACFDFSVSTLTCSTGACESSLPPIQPFPLFFESDSLQSYIIGIREPVSQPSISYHWKAWMTWFLTLLGIEPGSSNLASMQWEKMGLLPLKPTHSPAGSPERWQQYCLWHVPVFAIRTTNVTRRHH